MKVIKRTSMGGEWVKKGEDVKDGDVVTILHGGSIISGEYGDRHVCKIKTRNGEKNLSLNQTSLNNLVDVYGDESDAWAGKEAKVFMVRALVSGKMQNIVYLASPKAEMEILNDGSFRFTVGAVKSDSAVDDEEIDPKDIPF